MTILFIQIPCYNEADTLGETLQDIPRVISGISEIKTLVIDDGSSDKTVQVAFENGADYVVRHRRNRGLARAFMTGITAALALGADIIINTDADHQYPGRYIPELVAPIFTNQADLVIADRQAGRNIHFSPVKRLFQVIGSWVIRKISNTDAPDAPSGFRAYSRYCALRIQVHNTFSYTLETLIQAGKQRMSIAHVVIQTNPNLRPSRLHKGIFNFIWQQAGTIIRSYVIYQPLKSFVTLGSPFMAAGVFLLGRFLYFYSMGVGGSRYIQSVSIGGTLFIFGMLLIFLGLLGDAMRANRQMLEEALVHLRDKKFSSNQDRINGIDDALLIRREDYLRQNSL
ncbi:MAG: glycosyltransferase family 2 protein [Anaerolineales bacterium]|nr:glycosyltransferase family 2 protein [Anaerolineales bacterium]